MERPLPRPPGALGSGRRQKQTEGAVGRSLYSGCRAKEPERPGGQDGLGLIA